MDSIDVDPLASFDSDATESELPRSITNARKFFDKRLYNAIVDTVSAECKRITRWEGRDYEMGQLVGAMFTLTHRMMDTAYVVLPTPEQITGCVEAARSLRVVLHILDAKCTPWVHVWTCHVPQFLTTWGTLHPFLCHGFEGRWRQLKAEIRLSSHGQWKGAHCGFETVIHYSIVAWTLMSLKVALVGRSFHVSKRIGSELWDRFVLRVRNMVKARENQRNAHIGI